MNKNDCTRCEWFSNFGCSKGLLMFSQCEWFVDWEEATEARLSGRARLTSRAPSTEGSTAKPIDNKDKDED